MNADLALALELADLADVATMRHFRSRTLVVDHKQDDSEVTAGDRESERVMRARLRETRPDHAVLGEEDGLDGNESSPWRWVLDPIDGTSNYARGIPVWATLIGLLHEGRPVVGVVSAPALHRRWWAAKGEGAWTDDGPLRVSTQSDLGAAYLATAGHAYWAERYESWIGLCRSVWRDRGFGDFWQHMLVAEGAVDVACEPIVNLWDLAAIQPIVEEAGGRFTDLSGVARPDGGNALSSNGLLHDTVLAALQPKS